MKGMQSIRMVPYDGNCYLFFCVGLSRKEILEKVGPNGMMYMNGCNSVHGIKRRSEFQKKCKKLFKDQGFPSIGLGEVYFGELCSNKKDGLYFINMTDIDWVNASASKKVEFTVNLAHEVLHVCQEFLPKFMNRDEEAEGEGYFHTYLMRDIIETLDQDNFW